MHVVLPLKNLTESFLDTANYLASTLNCQKITYETSNHIITTMVEEAVFNRLKWTVKRNAVEETLQLHIPFWVPHTAPGPLEWKRASMRLYRIGIEKPELQIGQYLDELMGMEGTDLMWMVWHTLKLGDDLVLERGADFRIIEQERRMSRLT